MEVVTLKRLLFSRLKAWHFYASALSLLSVTCFMLLVSPTSPNNGENGYSSEDISSGFVSLDKLNAVAPRAAARDKTGKDDATDKKPEFSSWGYVQKQQEERLNQTGGIPDGPYEVFLQKPIINAHNFPYIINHPDKCQGQPVHLVITTPSAPANFFRRMKSRRSQPSKSHIRHLFFLGASNDSGIQAKVQAESAVYGDIIQEDYLDVYKNITFKAVQMLKWVSEFCPNSRYVIRLDDDVKADVGKLLNVMTRAHDRYSEFVMGTVKRGWPPCRIPKCLTTKEEYPYATLPPFALGGALGYPTSSVRRLYEATKRVKLFKLDDVFVTGMCAPLAHVVLLEDIAFSFEHHAW